MTTSKAHADSPRTHSAVVSRSVIGVVAAPVTAFCSGAATLTYLRPGTIWLGLLMTLVLVAGVVLLSAWSPLTGSIAGGLLGSVMIFFLAAGMVPNLSRPADGINGIILFGCAGILSAALVSAYLVTAIWRGITSQRRSA